MQNKKIVLLASDCESSRWMYNPLNNDFKFAMVLIESPISKFLLLKRRVKKIGILKILSQSLFSLIIVPILKKNAKNQRAFLINKYKLIDTDFDCNNTKWLKSINDDECKNYLQQLNPAIILVNGTRIISKKILECTNALFVNMHVGITPWYRGSHGGYWALHNKDEMNFGTTIHLVDTGVDTGAVIEKAFAKPQKEDNFTTYQIIQSAIGINLLRNILPKLILGDFTIKKHVEKGVMYYQPTLWQYFINKTK
jgi:folate-dependent phosphoribosylglycinamide formyltransferase PurN